MVPFPSLCPDVIHSILESAEVYFMENATLIKDWVIKF